MTGDATAPTVFVGGPFKGLVDPVTGVIDPAFQRRYARVNDHFRGHGWRVLNAHEEEGWGAAMVRAADCTGRDLRWMRECDVFVAFPGDPASPGTHVEIGWASALGRPTVLVLDRGAVYADLVTGLHGVAPVAFVEYDEGAAFFTALSARVHEVSGLAVVRPRAPLTGS